MAGLTLVDVVHGKELVFADLPQQVDATQVYAWMDYDLSNGALPPVAVMTVSSTSGDVPFTVMVDAADSYDPDGYIVACDWDFGDGATASGLIAEHTYTQPGSFTASLTVTDNDGVQSTASAVITVNDPNVILPPSNLTASTSGRTITLRWADNSGNETGFSIERGVKVKGGTSYQPVGVTAANTTSFAETAPAGTHYYRVQAFSTVTGAASDYSSTVSVRVR